MPSVLSLLDETVSTELTTEECCHVNNCFGKIQTSLPCWLRFLDKNGRGKNSYRNMGILFMKNSEKTSVNPKFKNYELTLRTDLDKGKSRWSENICCDWFIYFLNYNPLTQIILHNPLSSLRWDFRVIMCLVYFIYVYIMVDFDPHPYEKKHYEFDKEGFESTHSELFKEKILIEEELQNLKNKKIDFARERQKEVEDFKEKSNSLLTETESRRRLNEGNELRKAIEKMKQEENKAVGRTKEAEKMNRSKSEDLLEKRIVDLKRFASEGINVNFDANGKKYSSGISEFNDLMKKFPKWEDFKKKFKNNPDVSEDEEATSADSGATDGEEENPKEHQKKIQSKIDNREEEQKTNRGASHRVEQFENKKNVKRSMSEEIPPKRIIHIKRSASAENTTKKQIQYQDKTAMKNIEESLAKLKEESEGLKDYWKSKTAFMFKGAKKIFTEISRSRNSNFMSDKIATLKTQLMKSYNVEHAKYSANMFKLLDKEQKGNEDWKKLIANEENLQRQKYTKEKEIEFKKKNFESWWNETILPPKSSLAQVLSPLFLINAMLQRTIIAQMAACKCVQKCDSLPRRMAKNVSRLFLYLYLIGTIVVLCFLHKNGWLITGRKSTECFTTIVWGFVFDLVKSALLFTYKIFCGSEKLTWKHYKAWKNIGFPDMVSLQTNKPLLKMVRQKAQNELDYLNGESEKQEAKSQRKISHAELEKLMESVLCDFAEVQKMVKKLKLTPPYTFEEAKKLFSNLTKNVAKPKTLCKHSTDEALESFEFDEFRPFDYIEEQMEQESRNMNQ